MGPINTSVYWHLKLEDNGYDPGVQRSAIVAAHDDAIHAHPLACLFHRDCSVTSSMIECLGPMGKNQALIGLLGEAIIESPEHAKRREEDSRRASGFVIGLW